MRRRKNIRIHSVFFSLLPFPLLLSVARILLFSLKKEKKKKEFCCVPSLYSLLVGKFLMKDVFLCFSSIEKKEKYLRRQILETVLANTMSYEKGKGKRKFVTPFACPPAEWLRCFHSAFAEGFFFAFAEEVLLVAALLVVFFFASEETGSEALPVEEDFLDVVFPAEGGAIFFLTAFFCSDAFSPDGVSAGFFLDDVFFAEVFFPVSDEEVFAVFFFASEDAVFLVEADTAFAFVPDEETEDDAFVAFLAGAFFSVFVAAVFFFVVAFLAVVPSPDDVFAFADVVFFFVVMVFLVAVFSPDMEGDVFLLLSVFDVAFTDVFPAAEAFFLVTAFAFAGVFPAFADDPAFFAEDPSEGDFCACLVPSFSSL